ncbi:MAG: hypothetical protein ACPGWR_31780, partial [Ardenticatenaceae bacterium]
VQQLVEYAQRLACSATGRKGRLNKLAATKVGLNKLVQIDINLVPLCQKVQPTAVRLRDEASRL